MFGSSHRFPSMLERARASGFRYHAGPIWVRLMAELVVHTHMELCIHETNLSIACLDKLLLKLDTLDESLH